MQKIETELCYAQLEKAAFSHVRSRIPNSQDDFGDEYTVGLCVKRKGVNIFEGHPDDTFGLYLGVDANNRYIVGINKLGARYEFVSGEAFDSLVDLKEKWTLD